MATDEAIRQWVEFARGAGYLRVSGERRFGSDLAKVLAIEEEERSLFLFARRSGLGFPERVVERIAGGPSPRSGAEHRVYFDLPDFGRVLKITHPGKYGRREHTVFQYLERWDLMNQIAPAVDVRFEDCIRSDTGEFSVVMSMQFIAGPHPELDAVVEFVERRGFETLRDRSITLDFVNWNEGLILRDCHPKNWIAAGGALVPVDIIPEVVEEQAGGGDA
ncbi:MAG: hypothetical protein WA771_11195 [Chthoniobacterales bacterium]